MRPGRFGTALRVEWLKIITTRMWWILLLVMVGYIGVIAVFIAFAFTSAQQDVTGTAPSVDDRTTLLAAYTLGLPLGYVFPVVLGVLAMTAEYRYQTLTPTFLGEPKRGLVLTAKLLVNVLLGLFAGVLALGASLVAAAPVIALTGHATMLGDPLIWRSLVIIAFSQLVEPLARFGLNAWSATRDVAQFLPGAAADAMAGASLYNINSTVQMLRWWQGGLVLAAYAALFCLLGARTTLRRDVT
jgi:hypothetical protein